MKYNCFINDSSIEGNSIDELLQQLEIEIGFYDYESQVASIKDNIQSLTPNTPIIFEENENLSVMAKLEYAPHHNKDVHKILYKPSYKLWLHAVVHELMHLEMYIKASQCHRGVIFKKNFENDLYFNRQFGTAFSKLIPRIGADKVTHLQRMIHDSLITQLLSCPLDLFVEQHIHDRYKGIVLLQLASLLAQERININQYNDSTVSLMPPKIVSVNKILCLTSSLLLKELFGLDFLDLYNAKKSEKSMALDFFEEYHAYRDTFTDGDEYELYDYYSESLNIGHIVNKLKE